MFIASWPILSTHQYTTARPRLLALKVGGVILTVFKTLFIFFQFVKLATLTKCVRIKFI